MSDPQAGENESKVVNANNFPIRPKVGIYLQKRKRSWGGSRSESDCRFSETDT